MQPKTRKAFKRMGAALLWLVVLTGFVILVVAASNDKDAATCRGIVVKLVGKDDNFFIEEKDIKALVAKDRATNPVGMPISNINIAALEKIVSRDPWVKEADIYMDNQRKLNIRVTQREPVARIFTTTGNSFYLDTEGERIPVSTRYAARVPVFTDFPTDAVRLQKADSVLVAGIMEMGRYVLADPFWMAQVEQVMITGDREFEIIPKLGDHVIAFGDGTDIEKKFGKLLAFYKEGLNRVGWNNYSRINVAFENEIVCTRKDGAAPPPPRPVSPIDSARLAGPDEPPVGDVDEDAHAAAATPPPAPKPAAVKQPEKTTIKPKAKETARKTAPAKSKARKQADAAQRQPKAVYKPANKSVNTTKNNKTP